MSVSEQLGRAGNSSAWSTFAVQQLHPEAGPLGFSNYNDWEITLPGDSEKQPPNVATPTLPSDETSLPIYWACRESPCLPTWTRIPHLVYPSLVYLSASSVRGGNKLLVWGPGRSVPGRWVLQQLWRITHSGKWQVPLHVHRAGKSPQRGCPCLLRSSTDTSLSVFLIKRVMVFPFGNCVLWQVNF